MLLPTLLAASGAFTAVVTWLLLRPPIAREADAVRIEPVRRLIKKVPPESDASFDPGQFKSDLR